MTALLTATLAMVGILSVFNLLLTVGVIRRLRAHSEQLAATRLGPPAELIAVAGTRVGEFVTTDTEGEPVVRDHLSGPTLVGFLSPDCGACHERLPEFVALAEGFAGGQRRVLAVLAGEPGQVEDLRIQLAPVARVTVEPFDGPVHTALGVRGWPAFALVGPEGVVVASGVAPADLPVPASA